MKRSPEHIHQDFHVWWICGCCPGEECKDGWGSSGWVVVISVLSHKSVVFYLRVQLLQFLPCTFSKLVISNCNEKCACHVNTPRLAFWWSRKATFTRFVRHTCNVLTSLKFFWSRKTTFTKVVWHKCDGDAPWRTMNGFNRYWSNDATLTTFEGGAYLQLMINPPPPHLKYNCFSAFLFCWQLRQ